MGVIRALRALTGVYSNRLVPDDEGVSNPLSSSFALGLDLWVSTVYYLLRGFMFRRL